MDRDSAATDSATGEPSGDPAARLKDVRAQLDELRRRLKTERDPKSVAKLRAEVVALTETITALVRAARKKAPVKKNEPVVWPHDLADPRQRELDWGKDPEANARG